MTKLCIEPDAPIRCTDYSIGAIGAGFIMADVQLAAYQNAGFQVDAIASRTREKAESVGSRWNIESVYDSPKDLFEQSDVDIVDIAYPPHLQLDLVRSAVEAENIKGILLQKPLAPNYDDAAEIVRLCEANGKVLAANQNMRFDQSMRVLKQLLDAGELGDVVIASIDMRAIPHWQSYLADYDRLTLLNMSIHHLDVMRFLFGEVQSIYVGSRKDPRTEFEHTDGICISTLKFESGALGLCLDDTWASPVGDDFDSDIYIKWRVEGTKGIAQGTIGWPDYPDGSPSTLTYCSPSTGGKWETPTWNTMWFPDAFAGVMDELQYALANGCEPSICGSDNLKSIALVEAGYLSMTEGRDVTPDEVVR